MKKWLAILLSLTLAASLAACSGADNNGSTPSEPESGSSQIDSGEESFQPESAGQQPEESSSEKPTEPTEGTTESSQEQAASESAGEESGTSKILVAYFSYGENASLPDGVDASASASIQTWGDNLTGNTGVMANMIAEAAGADLFSIRTVEQYPDTYDGTIDQGQAEKSANARPALAALPENLDSYDVVFLGYPNWWGDMPMAVYSFLDQVDLTGKTVIPFVTSGGSGFSSTVSAIEGLEQGATVQEGLHLRDSSAAGAQEQISQWLAGLGCTG